jgi:hypothetical protein
MSLPTACFSFPFFLRSLIHPSPLPGLLPSTSYFLYLSLRAYPLFLITRLFICCWFLLNAGSVSSYIVGRLKIDDAEVSMDAGVGKKDQLPV